MQQLRVDHKTNMYIASRNLLAACFILTLPAALIARPFPTDGAAATVWDDFVRQFTKSNQERAKANSFNEGLDMTNKEIQNQVSSAILNFRIVSLVGAL